MINTFSHRDSQRIARIVPTVEHMVGGAIAAPTAIPRQITTGRIQVAVTTSAITAASGVSPGTGTADLKHVDDAGALSTIESYDPEITVYNYSGAIQSGKPILVENLQGQLWVVYSPGGAAATGVFGTARGVSQQIDTNSLITWNYVAGSGVELRIADPRYVDCPGSPVGYYLGLFDCHCGHTTDVNVSVNFFPNDVRPKTTRSVANTYQHLGTMYMENVLTSSTQFAVRAVGGPPGGGGGLFTVYNPTLVIMQML